MTSQWHYTSNGVPAGPVTSDDLRKLASEGKLKQTDLVWKDGMKAGVYAESLKNLFSTLPHSESQEETKNTNPFSNYLKNGIKVNSLKEIYSSYKKKLARRLVSILPNASVILVLTLVFLFTISFFLFGIARVGCNFGYLSLPWIQGFGNIFIYGIPIEGVLLLCPVAFWFSGWSEAGFLKGLISSVLALLLFSVAIMGVINRYPELRDIVFWRGQDGEFKEELVWVGTKSGLDLNPSIDTANGHKVWLHNNTEAKNPSWSQLKKFLNDDKTDAVPYQEKVFVCADFAEMLHNNAEAAGWRCAYVTINLSGSSAGHALNAFQTTDKDLVYIDCTGQSNDNGMKLTSSDKEVDLISDKPYIPKPVFDEGFIYSSMGDASNILVTW